MVTSFYVGCVVSVWFLLRRVFVSHLLFVTSHKIWHFSIEKFTFSMLEPPMTVVLFVCTYFDGNLFVKCCYNSICIWCKSYFVVSFVDRRNRSKNMWLLDDIYDVCSMFMCETKQQQQQLHTHFCDFLLFSGWHNNAFAENLFENQEEKKRTVANILHSHT